jgi:type III restriction enzyme
VPGVNNSGQYGRWSFAELKDVFAMEVDFQEKVAFEFNKMIENTIVK